MEAEEISSKEHLVVPSPASLSQAAADSLKMMEWVQLQVGLIRKEVDQALGGLIAGLELKPNGSQNRVELLGYAGSALGFVHGSIPEPDPVLDLIPDPGSDPSSDLGFSSGSCSDLSDPLPTESSPGLLVLGNPLGSEWVSGALGAGGRDSYAGGKRLGFYVGVS